MMKLSIAVIDDGISIDVIPDLEFQLTYIDNNLQAESDSINPFSHGTICASIIKKYASEAKIGSIRVLNEERRGDLGGLLSALKWCMKNKIKLINLSIGTTQACDIPALYETVNEAIKKGCIIVAACKNGSNVSFPASFAKVIGVRADKSLTGSQYLFNKEPNGGIELSASACHDINLLPDTDKISVSEFNSYAAPVISAMVYNLLASKTRSISLEEIWKEIHINASSGCLSNNNYLNIVQSFINNNLYNSAISDNNVSDTTEEVPIVIFQGDKQLILMRKIAERFLNDNYLPLLFSQSTDDCSAECFYIENISALKNSYDKIAIFYDADVILAIINEADMKSLAVDVIVINNDKDTAFICNDKKIELGLNYSLLCAESNIDELYKQLILLLEEF